MVLGSCLLLAGLLASCTKDDAAGAARPPSELVTRLGALADDGCACKDAACAADVSKRLQQLADGTTHVDDRDRPALQETQARLDACLAELDPVIIAYRGLVDDVCACADKACGQRVSKRFSAWAADLEASGAALRPADAKAVMRAGIRAKGCLDRFGLPVPQ